MHTVRGVLALCPMDRTSRFSRSVVVDLETNALATGVCRTICASKLPVSGPISRNISFEVTLVVRSIAVTPTGASLPSGSVVRHEAVAHWPW